MSQESLMVRFCRTMGFALIGIFSLCYALGFRNFAEIHVQLPSLNFPIFIGEWLFLACIFLFMGQLGGKSPISQRWFVYISLYVGWLFMKTLHGYFTSGPLALRHAVLFYYPLFAVLTYCFYDRKYFQNQVVLVGLLIAIIAFDRMMTTRYFHLYFLALAAIIIMHLKNKNLRYVFILVIVCVFPWDQMFKGARGHVISVIGAVFYLTACIIFVFLKGKRGLQLGLLFLIIFGMVFGLKKFANKDKLNSLIAFPQILRSYQMTEAQISEKIKVFRFKEIQPKLYNPEQTNLALKVFNDKTINVFDDAFNVKFNVAQKEVVNEIYESMVPSLESKQKEVKPTQKSDEVSEILTNPSTALNSQIDQIITDRFEILFQELSQLYKMTNEDVKTKGSKFIDSIIQQARIKSQENFDRANEDINAKFKLEYEDHSALSQDQLVSLLDKNYDIVQEKLKNVKKEFEIRLENIGMSRSINIEIGNILFRVFIWHDMLDDMIQDKAVLGVNLGKPQRSKRLEISGQAYGEWSRDGWITPHNSFFHMIYRGGIVGVLIVGMFYFSIVAYTKKFLRNKSLTGIILISVMIYWIIIANTLVILEFPYYAIPVWSLFGMMLAYSRNLQSQNPA